MKKQKWIWFIDQWLEDKIWTQVPEEVASPHFFFLLGFLSGIVTLIILFYIKYLIT